MVCAGEGDDFAARPTAGTGTIESPGGPDTESVFGGHGDDHTSGGRGTGDAVAGERGDDFLQGGPGVGDACDGGPGADSAETAGSWGDDSKSHSR